MHEMDEVTRVLRKDFYFCSTCKIVYLMLFYENLSNTKMSGSTGRFDDFLATYTHTHSYKHNIHLRISVRIKVKPLA